MIDIDDIDKCKNVGIWSLTKLKYVMNCQTGIYIHRLVMNCPDDLEVDHIFHNTLDNRKSQLRLSTPTQQLFNTKLRVDNKSGQRGLYWDKERNKWHVNIKNGANRICKRFDDYDEACAYIERKYDEWHREFKYDNRSISNIITTQ